MDIPAPSLSTYQDKQTFKFDEVSAKKRSRPYLGPSFTGPDNSEVTSELRKRLKEYYSIDELAKFLKTKHIQDDGTSARKYKKVTLQFPDSLISDSSFIVQELQDRLKIGDLKCDTPGNQTDVDKGEEDKKCSNCGSCDIKLRCETSCSNTEQKEQKIWILADTSYSPCCIDEVAAEHVSSDLAIHFGDACLTPIAKLPAVYVFGKPYLDLEIVVNQFLNRYTDHEEKIILMADAPYSYHLKHLYDALVSQYPNICYADLLVENNSATIIGYAVNQSSRIKAVSRTIIGLPEDLNDISNELSEYSLFHISTPEPPRLLQLSTTFNSLSLYDPEANEVSQGPFPNLMRRYRYMHVARSAGTVGILVNTLSLQNTKVLLNSVARTIKEAGKKHYMFVVGKPNVAKLANFESIDIWCILGCGNSGIIVDSVGEYFKPIITPYELQLALSPEVSWTGKWVTDFKFVLEMLHEEEENQISEVKEDNKEDWEDEAPEFNMVTGKYTSNSRPLRRYQHLQIENEASEQNVNESTLVKKFSSAVTVGGTVVTSAIHLQNRAWSGLGSDFKDTDVDEEGAMVEEGRGGVARGYDFDREAFHVN